jgi:hypothetical protein
MLGLKRHVAVLFSHCKHLRVKAETQEPIFGQQKLEHTSLVVGTPNTRHQDGGCFNK